MELYSPSLFIEINTSEYIFAVGDENEKRDFKIIYKHNTPIQGFENFKVTSLDIALDVIKKNIYLIEQKLNFQFKKAIIVIDNLNCSFINLTGFKKLNGSQILKENISYILNSLKSNIDVTEKKKVITHMFNSNYFLDGIKNENLPIGLFGDFYSQELSVCLLNNNDYKNLNNIFDKVNLKIKRILFKGFVEGSYLSNKHEKVDTFYIININENNSKISFFDEDCLKFEENFNFGSNLITKDISKVTSLDTDTITEIIKKANLENNIAEDELIEEKFFKNVNYIKLKKKLLLEISEARIQEILEIIILKNINFANYNKKNKEIFLRIRNQPHLKCFKDIYKSLLTKNYDFKVKYLENTSSEELMFNANKLVHFGWKKEAIPVTHTRKSLIAKLFGALFD